MYTHIPQKTYCWGELEWTWNKTELGSASGQISSIRSMLVQYPPTQPAICEEINFSMTIPGYILVARGPSPPYVTPVNICSIASLNPCTVCEIKKMAAKMLGKLNLRMVWFCIVKRTKLKTPAKGLPTTRQLSLLNQGHCFVAKPTIPTRGWRY